MILVDTSVWIDLFSKRPRFRVPAEKLPLLCTCPPVIQEVLQGIRDEDAWRRIQDGFLSMPLFGSPVSLDLYLEASSLYRFARQKGVTVRSSADCLIATIASKHELAVWHHDRDFDQIARMTLLKTISDL
jgi:hypothetical protein